METNMFRQFDEGVLAANGENIDMAGRSWNEHRDFSGVYLKNVVSAEQTEGVMSCHLVRIEPNKMIGMHTHPASIELHEVIAGSGVCVTEQGTVDYRPGRVAVLDRNAPHEVRAGENGLCLFAKFITPQA